MRSSTSSLSSINSWANAKLALVSVILAAAFAAASAKHSACNSAKLSTSSKGNVFLQYLEISSNKIPFIAERNPLKFNKYTPGNYIKIISEKVSRVKKPNYYLVLPWHFKNEILKREIKIRKLGTKFIFPLPTLKVI